MPVAASTPVVPSREEQKSCLRQMQVLVKKNMLLQWRNKAATSAQIFVGTAFILVLLLMDVAVTQNSRSNKWYIENLEPQAIKAHHLTRCSGDGCYSLLVYGSSEVEKSLAGKVADVLDLGSKEWHFVNRTENTLKEWLFNHENTSRVALEFRGLGGFGVNMPGEYILHYNSTRNCDQTGVFFCEDPYRELIVPLMTATDSVLLREFVNNENATEADAKARLKVSFKDFPHGDFSIVVDVMQRFGVGFIFMAVAFNFMVQLRNIVIEKQLKLRDAMRQIGLMDSAYWSSWIISSVVINTSATLALIAMGAIAQFPFFLLNDFGCYFIHLWISLWMFSCAALLISSLTHSEQTASNIGLLFFLLFYLFGQLVTFLFFGEFSAALGTNAYSFDVYRYLFMLVPGFAAPFGFYQGMNQMVLATSNGGGGLRFSEIDLNIMPERTLNDGSVETTFWSLNLTWGLMFLNSFVCLLLAVYFDNALPNSYGRTRGWCFCISSLFKYQRKGGGADANRAEVDESDLALMAPAVRAEAERIVKREWDADSAPPVQVKSMFIVFEGWTLCERVSQCFSCLLCQKAPRPANVVKAVQGITYGIDKDQLFVLLGHNGAGKTTTINALVGNLRSTGGTASVFDYDIGEEMDCINKIMGVCPQHDILWSQLTGSEHLELFSVLRGVPENEVSREVQSRLDDVNLVRSGGTTAGAYSGGMRRRLSIALALLGNPKIIYLDEPTTGMDPVTRRSVWDMIMRAKLGRVIVLTTHSMEEADVLGDRVAIMSHGKIQAMGTSLSLKREYGGGYKMTIIAKAPQFTDGVMEFISRTLEGSSLESKVDNALFFRIPDVDDRDLIEFFLEVEARREEIGISDLSIGLTTLEEVFLTLSKMDENEEFSYGRSKREQSKEARKITPRFTYKLPEGTEPGTKLAIAHVQFPEDRGMDIEFEVPSWKTGGDLVRVPYAKFPEFEYVIPDACEQGSRLSIPHPQADQGGGSLSYIVPEGISPGDTVKIPYKEVEFTTKKQKLKFVIPDGAAAGTQLSIPVAVEGVSPILYTVPEGSVSGTEVEIEFDVPTTTTSVNEKETGQKLDEPTPASAISVDSASGESIKPALPTFCGYLSALTIKTLQFQRTRLLQTCCVVCMPVVLMLLLLLLGLLFDSLKLQILCGEDVTKADCLEKGYNMTCVRNILENSGRPSTPDIIVGEASWGSINPNCGTDKAEGDGGRVYACYDGLEKAKFNDIPFAASDKSNYGLGKISSNRDPALIDWYEGFRYTLTSSRCQSEYDNKFAYETYCKNDKTPDCQERLRNLVRTRAWKARKDAEDAGDTIPSISFLDTCKPDADERRRRLQSTWEPSAKQLEEYQKYVDEKTVCDSTWLLGVSERLRASPLNASTINDLLEVKGDGVLGEFSTLDYVDEGMGSLELSVLDSLWKNLSFTSEDRCLDVGSSEAELTALCNSSITPTPNLLINGIRPPVRTLSEIYSNSSCYQCIGGILGRLAQPLESILHGYTEPYPGATQHKNVLTHLSLLAFNGYAPSSFEFLHPRLGILGFSFGHLFDRWSTSYCRVLEIQDVFESGVMFQSPTWVNNQNSTLFLAEDKKLWEAAWPPIYRAFMHAFDFSSVENGRKAWDVFCALDANLDSVRGLTFIDQKSTKEVNAALIDNWYGDNVNTDYMKATSDRTLEGFRHHYYDSHIMAFDFGEANVKTGIFDITAYFNNSGTEGGQRGTADASKTHNGNWIPITNMIVKAIYNHLVGTDSRPDVMLQEFPNKFKCNRDEWLEGKADLDCPALIPSQLQGSPLDSILDVFLPIILMLMIYPTVTSIVYEKQERLLIIMKMQGLPTPIYYLVTYAVHYAMYISIIFLMWIVGSLASVGIFTLHDQGIMWLLLIIWGHLCIAFSFFMSTFFSSMRAAMAVTFLAILIMWIVGGSVFGQFYDNYENTQEISYTIMGLLPPWVMARWAKWVISMAVEGTSITSDNWTTLGNGVLPTTMWVMVLEWFIYMGLYWYLENILSAGGGTSKSLCFCVTCGENKENGSSTLSGEDFDGIPDRVHKSSSSGKWSRPHDVQAEHERVVDFSKKGKDEGPRVRICNMHKVYPATGGAPEKMAVKSVSFGVNEKECFGLLGHNGAGKTTLLNVLTGLFPSTSGTAFIDDYRLDKDMAKIYAVMGVCPQHDILWGSLNGRQHVEFFGRLKGYSGKALQKMVDRVLKSVNLSGAQKRSASGYSGGMKRRLSVANSIVGGPEIVYME